MQPELALEVASPQASNMAVDYADDLARRLAAIRHELADEYGAEHDHPWIIGFSGGKDSTLVCHLVSEMLLSLPPTARRRQVHVVSNDTLVESPLVIGHLRKVTGQIRQAAESFGLPVRVEITTPNPDETFWVNLIGRGYPAPNRSFRWCTDRLKILPTSRYIRTQSAGTGRSILLLGVRRDESATRSGTITRYGKEGRLNPHNDLQDCLVFRPIVELTTEDVWEFLAMNQPPWGGTHSDLIALYRHAQGGECPVVTQKSDAPSCGTTSSRFGCWTCTVVQKDRSLEGFVEAGFAQFAPLIAFRDDLARMRNDPTLRQARRRTGAVTITAKGKFVPGPFTPEARQAILNSLLKLQDEVDLPLISPDEIARIRRVWAEEAATSMERLLTERDMIESWQAD
jgi:DNA sulfur modification protein DndC